MVEEIWRDAFDWVYRKADDYAIFPMTIHPDVSGRPQVLSMHERLYEHMSSKPGVRFVTMREIADGTGYFSSSRVHCKNCCEKHHKDGRVTYYHQMLGAVVVHPEQREVFPLAPEPIVKGDGATKNDCERNAAKRLLGDVRREHPHLKLIVVEDGLASNGPHIQLLKQRLQTPPAAGVVAREALRATSSCGPASATGRAPYGEPRPASKTEAVIPAQANP